MTTNSTSFFDRLLRPVLASRFVTVSLVIHLLIVLLFGSRVLFDRYVEPPDFQATGETMVSTDTAPPPPAPEANLPPAPSLSAPPPQAAAGLSAIAALNALPSNFSIPVPVVAPPTIGQDLTPQTQQVQSIDTASSVALPTVIAGRGSGREATGRSYGETAESEVAVMHALRWLQTQQNTDGTWGSGPYQGAMTGLGLLCFLGHGETPGHSAEFSVVVTNAIGALVAEGNRNGGRLSFTPNFEDHDGYWHPSAYTHGICTYALCEAYTMTKDARIAPVVTQAVDYIVKGQRPDGGWAYSYDLTPDGDRSDTSVSGWQIQALKAAHMTGLPHMADTVQPVLGKAISNLDRVFNPKDGAFGYRKAGDKDYTLTGVGVLAKLFWLGRADTTVEKGVADIQSKQLDYNGKDCNLYAWYYDTQACFQAQGAAWEWWNSRFQDILTTAQSSDGSWPPTGGNDIGDFTNKPDGNGPVYRTVLCTLMLEVYYRYLPTNQDNALGSGGVEGL